MARIRSVKPEFFKHYDLFTAEQETNLPLRLAFSGLWTVADREGRFKWRPQQIKLDVLPYDNVDMEVVLGTLEEFGYICKYKINDKEYGFIPTWQQHQRPSREEPPSEIPAPNGEMTEYDRPPNQTIRYKIYERDGFCCLYCGDNLKDKVRSICLDHVIPYSKGGTNRPKNLATACKKCNSIKGDRTPKECGFSWPQGLGEGYQQGVNGGLTEGQHPPDTEREGKGKGNGEGREKEGKGEEYVQPPPIVGEVIYDIQEELIKNQIRFEAICMSAKKTKGTAIESLRKYHLYLVDKEQYPKTKKAAFAGFEKWLMNEKNYSNGTTHRNGSQSATAGGQDPTRIAIEGIGEL